MKRILIFAHDFPPYNSVGSFRPYSWYKYLPEAGVHPIIVTRHWDNIQNNPLDYVISSNAQEISVVTEGNATIIRVPYKSNLRDRILLNYGNTKYVLVRKILSFLALVLAYPVSLFDNKWSLYKAANNYLKSNSVDVILASGEPFILFKYARLLAKKYKVPYLLDYRDGWTSKDDNLKASGLNRILNNYWFRFFEKKYLRDAKLVITSNPFEQEKLKDLVSSIQTATVFNGYIEEEIEEVKQVQQKSDKFRIAFAGTIYAYHRLEDFLEGFSIFIQRNPEANTEIHFLGIEYQPEQVQRIKSYNSAINKYIHTTPRLPKRMLFTQLAESNLLLVLTNPANRLLPAKIYEYLALERKVLVSVNDESDLQMIVNETNAGYNCSDAKEIALSLEQAYFEFKQTGKVSSTATNYKSYSRKNQAFNLAKLLERL